MKEKQNDENKNLTINGTKKDSSEKCYKKHKKAKKNDQADFGEKPFRHICK